jgi:hypothetical protein
VVPAVVLGLVFVGFLYVAFGGSTTTEPGKGPIDNNTRVERPVTPAPVPATPKPATPNQLIARRDRAERPHKKCGRSLLLSPHLSPHAWNVVEPPLPLWAICFSPSATKGAGTASIPAETKRAGFGN